MGFAPDWLALREPADHQARDTGLLTQAAAAVGAEGTVLDLGAGTGSTARAFGPKPGWRWRFFDADPALLQRAGAAHPQADLVQGDLKDIAALPLQDVTLVTASALLDLMPQDWVMGLAKRLKSLGIPFYAALSYNGLMSWTPPNAADAAITAAFNAHQRRDKGIGPALGPRAAPETAQIFAEAGFTVTTAESPWRLGPQDAALQTMLLRGIGTAAEEAGAPTSAAWQQARLAEIAQLTTVIGHTDLLAFPHQGDTADV